jgi:hypothetical protein
VDDLRQVDEPHTVGMVLEPPGGKLEGEACLPAAAGTGERQHPDLGEQLAQHGEFGLATHEAREVDGKVVRDVVERAQRREPNGQVRVDELEHVLGSAQVAEAMGAEVLGGDRPG